MSKVWIPLDREVAERIKANRKGADGIYGKLGAEIYDAIDKSLVTECCVVGGEVQDTVFDRTIPVVPDGLPKDFPEGPCRVIVIAGERDG